MPMKFTSRDLKIIAMVTMTIDHAAYCLVGGGWLYMSLRLIGRLSFPIYCFLLTEGFLHTRDKRKYALRLGTLAVVSQIPYSMAFFGSFYELSNLNILFTLFLALIAMWAVSSFEKTGYGLAAAVVISVAGAVFTWFIKADYNGFSFLFIMSLYLLRYRIPERMMAGSVLLFLEYAVLGLASCGIAAMCSFYFINRYNGEKGKSMGYLPHLYYPAHLLILFGIEVLIYGINI